MRSSVGHSAGESVVTDALRRHCMLGTQEFFVSQEKMTELLRYILLQTTKPRMSLNRPQVGGRRLVHWVKWFGLKFTSVSRRPVVTS